jgi:ankyrin repeat protein
MDSATLQLGELISTGPESGSWLHADSKNYPRYSSTMLGQITTLLDKGADIHITVCIYTVDGSVSHVLYRFLGSNPTTDMLLERHSYRWSPTNQKPGFLAAIRSPLIDAADQGNGEVISSFADRGARFETILERLSACQIPTEKLLNPFLMAVSNNHYEIVKQTLNLADHEHPVVQNWAHQAFNEAAVSGVNDHIAMMFLRHGTQPTNTELDSSSSRAVINLAYRNQIQPAALSTSMPGFIRVVFLGNVDLCALVPRDLSDQTARGPHGITPLMVAVGNASTAVCQYLLDCGANPNEHDDFGMTALMDAIYYGHEEAVNLLLAHGAKTGKANFEPILPSYAVVPDWDDEWWIERIAYARKCKENGWCALHLAAYQGRLKALGALCNAGARIAAFDKYGDSPLDIAVRYGHYTAAYYLLSQNCPFHTYLASALFTRAIANCRYDLVTQMIEAGMSPPPNSGIKEEYTEVERLTRIKERNVNLLPQSIPQTGTPSNNGKVTFDLCVECSSSLKTAKLCLPSQTNSSCKLCQLLVDSNSVSTDAMRKLLYSMDSDAREGQLVTASRGLTFRHSIIRVQSEFVLCYRQDLQILPTLYAS